MKKLIALVLALALVFAVAVASAATITVTNMNADESYDVYKIFDAVISGNAVAYTIDSDATASTGVWALVKGTENASTHVWTNSTYGLTFTPTASDATVFVVDGSEMTDAKAAKLAEDLKTNIASISAAKVGTIDKNTTSLTNQAAGYYFVDSTMGSLCALATEDTTQEIREKNTPPSLLKQDSDSANGTFGKTTDVQVGDRVYFKLTITDGTGTDKALVLTDDMPDSLTFDSTNNDIAVSPAGTSGQVTITYPQGHSFQIDFTPEYMAALNANDTIVVTFSAILNENAVVGTPTVNEAEIVYSNQHDTDTANVNTHKAELLKYDTDVGEGTNLAGAIFELRNGSNVVNLVKDSATTYHVATAAEIAAKTAKSYTGATANDSAIVATDVVTNFITVNSGNIVINGLDDSVTTYKFVETKAPEGFNPLTEEKTFTVSVDNSTVVKVSNSKGTVLPSTGGIGTTIFYILGGLLVVGAAVILVARRRVHE